MDIFQQTITEQLKKLTGQQEILLEVPPDTKLGDYSFPCFQLAKTAKKNPKDIADDLKKRFKTDKYVPEVKTLGPYLNFFINKQILAEQMLKKIVTEKDKFGKGKAKKELILVEFPAPNTNKPLHLGHVRNIVLGQSLSNILEFSGFKVKRINLNNDRGIHICKSMLAYQKWGNGKEPDKKTDHFVGDFYVMFSQKAKEDDTLELEAQGLLKRWEEKDPETIKLWKKMNKWAMDGFDDTYSKFGLRYDKVYNESEHFEGGKEIILDALEKGIFTKAEDGSVIAPLSRFGLQDKVLLRADGTAIYITQDINLAKVRFKDFKFDRCIYVVGNEQIFHFNVLFKVFELLGFPFAKGCYHMAYGMVYLPEGRMKSREGNVVDADDIIAEVTELAHKEVLERHKDINSKEAGSRAFSIGMGALRYFMLKYDPAKDFTYNPKESLSFEGETGPYIQYAHARISSILRKHGKKLNPTVNYQMLNTELEQQLISILGRFEAVIDESALHYKPSLLAHYLLALSQRFNEYYHSTPILKASVEARDARLVLISCINQVLKNGLNLLSINAPDEM